MSKSIACIGIMLFLSLLFRQQCDAYPIDLNDFYAEGNVSISSDGDSATLQEDPDFGSVYLSNDPWFFDPGVFIASDAFSITFDYSFVEPQGNVDEFYVKLFDWQTNAILSDAYGNPLELSVTDAGSGSVFWNLSGVSFLGDTVGMQIEMNYDPLNDRYPSRTMSENSSLLFSNLRVNPVPEPASGFTLAIGLLGLSVLALKTKGTKK